MSAEKLSSSECRQENFPEKYPLEIDVSGFSGLQAALLKAGLGSKISDFQAIFYDAVAEFLDGNSDLNLNIISPPNGDAVILGVPSVYTQYASGLPFLASKLKKLSAAIQIAFQDFLGTLNVSGHSFTGQCTFHLAEGTVYSLDFYEKEGPDDNVFPLYPKKEPILSVLDGPALIACKRKGTPGALKYTRKNGTFQEFSLEDLDIRNVRDLGDLFESLGRIQIQSIQSHTANAVNETLEYFRDTNPTCALKLPDVGAEEVDPSVIQAMLEKRQKVVEKMVAFVEGSPYRYTSIKLSFPKVDIPYAFFRMEITSSDSKMILEDLTKFIQDAKHAGLPIAVTYSPLTMQTYVSGGRGYDPASPALSDGARLLSKFKYEEEYGVILAQSFLDKILPGMEWQAQTFKGVGELRSWSRSFRGIGNTFNVEDALARKMFFSEKDSEVKASLMRAFKAEMSSDNKRIYHLKADHSGNGVSAFSRALYREILEDQESSQDVWLVSERDPSRFLAQLSAHNFDPEKKPRIILDAELWDLLTEEDKKGVKNLHPQMKILVVGRGDVVGSEVFKIDESEAKLKGLLAQAFEEKEKGQNDTVLNAGFDALKDALSRGGIALTVRYLIRFVLPELVFNSDDHWNYAPLIESAAIQKNKKSLLQTNFSLQSLEKNKFKREGAVPSEVALIYGPRNLVGVKWLAMFSQAGFWCPLKEFEARVFNGSSDATFRNEVLSLLDISEGRCRIKDEFREGLLYVSDEDVTSEKFKEEYLEAFKVASVIPVPSKEDFFVDQTFRTLNGGIDFKHALESMDARELFARLEFLIANGKLSFKVVDAVSVIFRRRQDIPSLRRLQRLMIKYVKALPEGAKTLNEWRMRALWLMIESYDTDAQKKYYQEWNVEGMLNALSDTNTEELSWKIFLVVSFADNAVIPPVPIQKVEDFTSPLYDFKKNGSGQYVGIFKKDKWQFWGIAGEQDKDSMIIAGIALQFYCKIQKFLGVFLQRDDLDPFLIWPLFSSYNTIRGRFNGEYSTKILQNMPFTLVDWYREREKAKDNDNDGAKNLIGMYSSDMLKLEEEYNALYPRGFYDVAVSMYKKLLVTSVPPDYPQTLDDYIRSVWESNGGLREFDVSFDDDFIGKHRDFCDKLITKIKEVNLYGLGFHEKFCKLILSKLNNEYFQYFIAKKMNGASDEELTAIYEEFVRILRENFLNFDSLFKLTSFAFLKDKNFV